MPETTSLPYVPAVDIDREPFKFGSDPLAEADAIYRVKRCFELAEQKRRSKHDVRWNEADDLYFGSVPVRRWPGTNTERSAIPNNIAYDHVEAAQGRTEAAFLDDPDLFAVEPTADSSAQDAKDIEDYFLAQLTTIPDDFSSSGAGAEMRQQWHQCLQYGTGFLELVYGPAGLQFKFLDLRDVYVDPQCSNPNLEAARYIIISRWLTIEAVRDMRNDPKFNIPSDDVLWTLSKMATITVGEQTKRNSEQTRGTNWEPNATAPNVNPEQALLQLKCYYDHQRIMWTLADTALIMNRANPYGFYPFVSSPCTMVPGGLYGIGLPEAIKWPQRYAEAFMNNFLDAAHLDMDPTMIVGRDVADSDTQIRPGQRIYTDNPKNSIVMQPKGLAFNAMPIVEWLLAMAAKRNASPDSFSGDVRPGKVRTAAGVAAQQGSSETKLKDIVKNIEDFSMSQALKKGYLMVRAHTLPGDILLGKYANPEQGGRRITADAFHKPVKFNMLAGARLARRERAMQLLPFISQAFLNGPTQEGIAAGGRTFNWQAYSDMAQDAVGKNYTFVIPMSEEEKQHRNQPPPQFVAEQQAQQAKDQLTARGQDMGLQGKQIDAQAKLQVAQIAKQPDQYADQQAQLKAYLAQQDGQQKMAMRQNDLQARQAEHQMNLEAKKQEAIVKAQTAQESLAMKRQEMGLKAQQMQMQHQADIQKLMLDAQRMRMGLNQPSGGGAKQPQ